MLVTDLALNPEQNFTRAGARVVAKFSVVTDDFICRDMMYVRLPSGTMTIWSPRARRDHNPTVTIRPELRARVLEAIVDHLAHFARLAA